MLQTCGQLKWNSTSVCLKTLALSRHILLLKPDSISTCSESRSSSHSEKDSRTSSQQNQLQQRVWTGMEISVENDSLDEDLLAMEIPPSKEEKEKDKTKPETTLVRLHFRFFLLWNWLSAASGRRCSRQTHSLSWRTEISPCRNQRYSSSSHLSDPLRQWLQKHPRVTSQREPEILTPTLWRLWLSTARSNTTWFLSALRFSFTFLPSIVHSSLPRTTQKEQRKLHTLSVL